MSNLLQFILSQEDQFRRARLPSLFSDFSTQRHTNPNGYVANVNIWKEAFCRAAGAGLVSASDGTIQRLSIETGPHLMQKLESKEWGRPLALNAVFNEAVSQGQMIPYRGFLSAPRSIYTRPWTDVPWRIISWGLEQIGLQQVFHDAGSTMSKDFVLIPNVEQAANKIVDRLQGRSSYVDRIFSAKRFKKEAAAALSLPGDLEDKDLKILLKYLARDRRFLLCDETVVKINGPDGTLVPISNEDQTVASLKNLVEDVNEGIHRLESQISSSMQRSKEAIVLKNRQSALAALKSKKLAESILSQRSDTLLQLEQVLESIKQASDQVTMLQVMKDSAGVLRSLNARVGSVENVEDALNSVKDEMEKVKDINSAINEAGLDPNAVDETEIDEELDGLLREHEQAEEERLAETTKRRLADIPERANINQAGEEKSPLPKSKEITASETEPDPSISEETTALQDMSLGV
ncbi:MAG: hypothetical protein Q9212_003869 [Teloschistes hypoglaucus]